MLWERITSWENLYAAWRAAASGKRGRAPAARFEHRVADRLLELQSTLREESYRPAPYTSFYVHEPKRRKISAAPFRDRVVHHALCRVVEPLFEERFHPHSYANRRGKGTHRAVTRLHSLARRYRYVLRMDVRKHFASIDHAVLIAELARVIRDDAAMRLVERVLESGAGILEDELGAADWDSDGRPLARVRACEGSARDAEAVDGAPRPARGLPIGNLTSQFWSNCYLNPLDWFVARELGCRAYVRYVDDLALFADDKAALWSWRAGVDARLERLRLRSHPGAQPQPTRGGVPWLGFVVYPTHRRVKQRNVVSARRRLVRLLGDYAAGRITFAVLDASVKGWINHVGHADTWGLRRHVFATLPPIRPSHAATAPQPGDFAT